MKSKSNSKRESARLNQSRPIRSLYSNPLHSIDEFTPTNTIMYTHHIQRQSSNILIHHVGRHSFHNGGARRSHPESAAPLTDKPNQASPTQHTPTSSSPYAQTPNVPLIPSALPPTPTLAATKRILAPHLFPLSTTSPWQQAKKDVKEEEERREREEKEKEDKDAADAAVAASASATVPPSSLSSTSAATTKSSKSATFFKKRTGALKKRTTTLLRRPYKLIQRISYHWLFRLSQLLEYGLSSEGNNVTIYFDGDEAFESMFHSIEHAQRRVCLETFMFHPDRVGKRIISTLAAAAQRGCQVIVIYDSTGSYKMEATTMDELRRLPNVHIVAFNPFLSALFQHTRKDISHRTHRKLLICDDIAYAGGMNTSEQYAGPRLGINEFRDTHMRVIGPAVDHLAEIFFQSLQEAHAHDKSTWKRIFRSVRSRAQSRVIGSNVVIGVVRILYERNSPTSRRAISYFEKQRERQYQREKELEMEEKEWLDTMASQRIAMGAAPHTTPTSKSMTSTETSSPASASTPLDGSALPSTLPSSSSSSSSPSPFGFSRVRANLARFRRFMSHRLHALGEASSTPRTWEMIKQFESEAQRRWKQAWRRIRRKKGGANNGEEGLQHGKAIEDFSYERNRPALTSSPITALASTFEAAHMPLNTPKSVVRSSSSSSSQPTSSSSASFSSSPSSSPSSSAGVPTPPSTSLPILYSSKSPSFSDVFVQVLPSNTIRQQYSLQNSLVDVLDNGLDYILITNPFLVPSLAIKNAILSAGKRGVTVRIICGGKSDTPYMRWSSTHVYHTFLRYPSIRIFEYQPRILHAKTITVDGLYSMIGSSNLDFLSSHKLLEVNVGILSTEVARVMEKQHQLDIEACVEVTKENLKQRNMFEKVLHWGTYHLARVMYSFSE